MSLAHRIIPCLDTDGSRVVKGVNFVGLRDAGDPAALAARYNAEGADELVVLDIAASRDRRPTFLETIRRVASELAIPLAAGGGIRSLDDARSVIRAGADKITVNTSAVERPELITELSHEFGAQAVVLAVDAKLLSPSKNSSFDSSSRANLGCAAVGDSFQVAPLASTPDNPRWEVRIRGGRDSAHLDALSWAQRAVELGAGEILLTSMDRDGTQSGFDVALTAAISRSVSVPVIASGGAKTPAHFAEVFSAGAADAALAASIFHDNIQSIRALKQFLVSQRIEVRFPC
jgi:imidazole glycerol-phosphate synthase subunit HisF